MNKTERIILERLEMLESKIETCRTFCEAILDEVTPMAIKLDIVAGDLPPD